ncbi:MAG: GGDEF domain-containing protein [Nitrospirae bacterium]|nr:GGDEF domain-containing protein [Nitrospirota bacterium]
MTEKPERRKMRSRMQWYRMSLGVLLLGLLSIALIFWINTIWKKQIQDFLLADAITDIRADIDAYHLDFEEHIRGRLNVFARHSMGHLESALKTVDILLYGGRREQGVFIEPLRDDKLRAHAEALKSLISEMGKTAREAGGKRESYMSSAQLEERFDGLIDQVVETSWLLEKAVERDITHDLAQFSRLFWGIILVWTCIIVIYTAGLGIIEKKRKKTAQELTQSQERYRSLVDSTEDSIYLVDREYRYLSMNYRHQARLGLSGEAFFLGHAYSDFHSRDEIQAFVNNVEKVFHTGESFQNEHKSKRDDRYFLQTLSPVRDSDGKITAVTVVSKDITDRKKMEEELRALSLTDELTGLYNRRGFFALTEQQLRIANRLKKGIFMLYADLDGLKSVNDSLGHQEGDQMLIETAAALKESFREADIVARIGGDEFVVLPIGTHEVGFDIVSKRLQKNLDIRNELKKIGYTLSLSIGIAHYDPEKPCTIDELLAQADRAMYEQKKKKQSGTD